MRREQPLPNGLRGFVADLHVAGAAVDFSVLSPEGRLVDAPLPTWSHRQLMLSRTGQDSPTHGGCTISVHPLLGAHVRLQEEPERHVWQAEVGIAAQPWLGGSPHPGRGRASRGGLLRNGPGCSEFRAG